MMTKKQLDFLAGFMITASFIGTGLIVADIIPDNGPVAWSFAGFMLLVAAVYAFFFLKPRRPS